MGYVMWFCVALRLHTIVICAHYYYCTLPNGIGILIPDDVVKFFCRKRRTPTIEW